MNTKAPATLIEFDHVAREYGFDGTEAIIDHPSHGRLYLTDGFGGLATMSGGAVRWRHGMAIKLQPGDTLESLKEAPWNDYCNLIDAVLNGYDDDRPVLDWPGYMVESMAKAVGL